MAGIKMIEPVEATGELKDESDKAAQRVGKIFIILKVPSLSPRVLRASNQLYLATMHGPSGLSRAEREVLGNVFFWAKHRFY